MVISYLCDFAAMLRLVRSSKADHNGGHCGSKHLPSAWTMCVYVCARLQSHKTEALAGKLSAVYGVMSTSDFIKQKQSHSGHKSQVRQWLLYAWIRRCPWSTAASCIVLLSACGPNARLLQHKRTKSLNLQDFQPYLLFKVHAAKMSSDCHPRQSLKT